MFLQTNHIKPLMPHHNHHNTEPPPSYSEGRQRWQPFTITTVHKTNLCTTMLPLTYYCLLESLSSSSPFALGMTSIMFLSLWLGCFRHSGSFWMTMMATMHNYTGATPLYSTNLDRYSLYNRDGSSWLPFQITQRTPFHIPLFAAPRSSQSHIGFRPSCQYCVSKSRSHSVSGWFRSWPCHWLKNWLPYLIAFFEHRASTPSGHRDDNDGER